MLALVRDMLRYLCQELQGIENLEVSGKTVFEQVIIVNGVGECFLSTGTVYDLTARLAERESRRVFVQADNSGNPWTLSAGRHCASSMPAAVFRRY